MRLPWLVACLCALPLTAARAQSQLRVATRPTAPCGVGAPCGPWVLSRDLPVSSNATVRVSTSLGPGELSLSIDGGWRTGALDVTFAGGSALSDPFYVRGNALGSLRLTASGAGFTPLQEDLKLGPAVLAEDFEGTFTVPSNRWTFRQVATGNSLGPSAAAAHRGAFGLRVDDATSRAGDGMEGAINLDLPALRPAVYVRTWVRVLPGTGASRVVLLGVYGGMPADSVDLAEVDVELPAGRLVLGAYDQTNVYVDYRTSFVLADGRWHLVEPTLDTTTGGRKLWVDGALILEGTPAGGPVPLTSVGIGMIWAAPRTSTAVADFDDFRASVEPQASALHLAALSGGSGDCVAFEVALRDATGASAAAPYDVAVELAVPGFTPYADESCQTEAKTAIPQGVSAARFSLRVARTRAELAASHPDFLPASLSWTGDLTDPPDPVDPTPGLPPGVEPGRLGTGCDCQAGGGMALLALAPLAPLAGHARRPRQRR